ncbi:MAG: ATP-binding cassette domain-containing protein [Butyrivibrio sp.]|nr:ATP-binding cassette domain-containing protein [Butyrivibrio sp.]
MSWFEEQIHTRKLNDDKVFEEAFLNVASAILGENEYKDLDDKCVITKEAIDEILKYYHYKPVDIPDNIKEPSEQLEYALWPHGLMHRNVKLSEGWTKNAFGPMMGLLEKDHTPVALLPYGLVGYCYHDFNTGQNIRINKNNENLFSKDAICFYRALPERKLKIKDLFVFIKNCLHPRDLWLMILSIFAATVLGLLTPKLSLILMGDVLNSGNVNALVGIGIFMIAAAASTQLINMVKSLYVERITITTDVSVEAAMMMRLLSLPASFYRKYNAGELASRSSSVGTLCEMLINIVITGNLTSVMSLIYVVQIFHYAPSLVVPSLIIILITIVFSVISTFMHMNISQAILEHEVKESGLSYSIISGIQKIKLSGSEKRAFALWANEYSDKARLMYNPPLFVKIDTVILTAISLFGNIIIFFLAAKNGVHVAEYIAFSVAYGLCFSAFQQLASLARTAALVKPVLEMAEPFLEAEPEIEDNKTVISRISGTIEISHVSFRYDETAPYIFDDLNLNIHAGDYVGIVGKTGCGKTTLIRLLLGFEKAEKGTIYYDGKDINNIDVKSLRKRIGTVMQNSALFQGDIFHNITIAAPKATLKDAWEAAEIAGIADDIRKMPMGMNTFVSEGGGGISGGQRQRIMIARAIATKPKILIFDEATSALDNKTQKQISDALDNLKCTRIVIAHRLSTIKNCNRILVIDKGQIVESGTYDELIKANGYFAELVERQRYE